MLQHHLAITNLKQSISQSSAKLQSTGGLTRQTGCWAASTEDWGMLPKTRAAFSPQKNKLFGLLDREQSNSLEPKKFRKIN